MDKEIYDKLCNYCACQERCVADVKGKLYKLKIATDEYKEYIDKLIDSNFLNEDRYAKYFVSAHAKKKWGKTKMKSALSRKGIAADIIKQYLDDMDADDYDERIKMLAEKKWNSIRTGLPRDKKTKVLRFLLSKGYEMNKALIAIKEFK